MGSGFINSNPNWDQRHHRQNRNELDEVTRMLNTRIAATIVHSDNRYEAAGCVQKQSLGFLALGLLILTCTTRAQQDVQLREKAVTLVERANAASIAQPFAPCEQTIVFRAYRAGKGTQEGRFTSVTLGPRA